MKKSKYEVVNNFDKIFKGNTVYKPCTPSKWLSGVRDSGKVTCIEVTCGGGIGGSRWNVFAEGDIMNDIAINTFITVTDINGIEQKINTNYIVTVVVYNTFTVDFHSDNSNVPLFFGDHTLRFYTSNSIKDIVTSDRYGN